MTDEARVGLIHYWLTNMRGGENVLAAICRMFPTADIFTHAYNPAKITGAIREHAVRETFIAQLPGARSGCQRYLPLMPLALRKLDLREYDLLVSSESGPAKGVHKRPGALHVCYCHTPMRYLWDMYEDYYAAASLPEKLFMRLCRERLRRYDLASSQGVDHFIANSSFVAARIRRIYGRESAVVYPPVDTEFYSPVSGAGGDYYLYVGELTGYKRPDLAVDACLKLGRKLVVVGQGGMLGRLAKLAAGSGLVEFAGRVDNQGLRNLYAGARALLFPGVEDFGIVPVEAQATGTPVIAFGQGGALETVLHGKTGLLFPEQTCRSLCEAIEEFETMHWSVDNCRTQALNFSAGRFRQNLAGEILRAASGTPLAEALGRMLTSINCDDHT